MAVAAGTAALGAAAIGGFSSILSGIIGADAANSAASTEEKMALASLKLQQDQYDQSRADTLPWITAGKDALKAYTGEVTGFDSAAYLKANPDVAANPTWAADPYGHYKTYGQAEGRAAPAYQSDFTQTPDYQFAVSEGEKGVVSNMRALGLAGSGAALKALTRFREGLASQKYGDYVNRLASLAGVGQTQVNNNASLGSTFASNAGATLTDAGNARSSGYIGAANAWTNALGGVSNNASGYLGWASRNPMAFA